MLMSLTHDKEKHLPSTGQDVFLAILKQILNRNV